VNRRVLLLPLQHLGLADARFNQRRQRNRASFDDPIPIAVFDNYRQFLVLSAQSGNLMNVSLTAKLEELVNEKVRSGLYHTASEVVREALRLLKLRDDEARRVGQQPESDQEKRKMKRKPRGGRRRVRR
jgi:putative addiction module CopG family antidote